MKARLGKDYSRFSGQKVPALCKLRVEKQCIETLNFQELLG